MTAKNSKEKGAMLPLLAVGTFAIIAVAGLAIDASHAFTNVTRVQNALDAAALSAASALHDNGKSTTIARTQGRQTFVEHLEGEMADGVTVSFEFSQTLSPWANTEDSPNFVRAVSDDHSIAMFFARILPGVGDNWDIGSTAVSGPIPIVGGEVCDLAPLLVCATDTDDTDPTDGTLGGLPIGSVQCLKFGAGTNTGSAPNECGVQPPDDPDGVGPGNYYLLNLDGGGGSGNEIRDFLAGGYPGCRSIGGAFPVDTSQGVKTGPVRQGFNTRFNDSSTTQYPSDLVDTSPMTYEQYESAYDRGAWTVPAGKPHRRIMGVPFADCDGIQNGRSEVEIFTIGCYFLRQKIKQGGQQSYIVGELIPTCNVGGTPGEDPALGGPFKIILFNDPGNPAT